MSCDLASQARSGTYSVRLNANLLDTHTPHHEPSSLLTLMRVLIAERDAPGGAVRYALHRGVRQAVDLNNHAVLWISSVLVGDYSTGPGNHKIKDPVPRVHK